MIKTIEIRANITIIAKILMKNNRLNIFVYYKKRNEIRFKIKL